MVCQSDVKDTEIRLPSCATPEILTMTVQMADAKNHGKSSTLHRRLSSPKYSRRLSVPLIKWLKLELIA